MFFRPKGHLSIHTDIHSHLIPGVDDGVTSIEESIEVIQAFQELGYRKLITTPHISESYYPNSVQILKEAFQPLKEALLDKNIPMEVELGAEYMVDGMLLTQLKNNEELLSWDGHLLIETSFRSLPWILDEVIFEIQSKRLIPVLAHPERYPYFFDDQKKLEELKGRGVRFQVTVGSFAGQYGPTQKKMAKKFLADGWVDFLGSDVHRMDHIAKLREGLKSRTLGRRRADEFLNGNLD